mmetsp:Transcript_10173/g.29028  ORF Transcript_10173/g.29028 Transcript_10173/m.29028 type:complete len:261 (+) Transcript_10173:1387-2169(+)
MARSRAMLATCLVSTTIAFCMIFSARTLVVAVCVASLTRPKLPHPRVRSTTRSSMVWTLRTSCAPSIWLIRRALIRSPSMDSPWRRRWIMEPPEWGETAGSTRSPADPETVAAERSRSKPFARRSSRLRTKACMPPPCTVTSSAYWLSTRVRAASPKEAPLSRTSGSASSPSPWPSPEDRASPDLTTKKCEAGAPRATTTWPRLYCRTCMRSATRRFSPESSSSIAWRARTTWSLTSRSIFASTSLCVPRSSSKSLASIT